MGDKTTIMVLKVDLQCCSCYKKVKKILCKFPQIRNQVYDEKNNTITISVVCCDPEKLRDKLCCKGCGVIKSIEIKEPEKLNVVVIENTKELEKQKEVEKLKKEVEKLKQKEAEKLKQKEAKQLMQKEAEKLKTKVLLERGYCCGQCYEGHTGGPCYQGYGRSVPPPPCYHYYGYIYGPCPGPCGCGRGCYVSRCDHRSVCL